MGRLQSFRDLKVYQTARREAKRIFEVTMTFPREEMYSLMDQIRRSSRAVGALLAEAWARRRYEAAFVDKVNRAMAEAMETQAWLDHALDCGYLSAEQHKELDAAWQRVGAMLNRMIQQSESFCRMYS